MENTVSKKDNTEEVPCCRVCHGESEPDNQLFYPCKCDGSIKYVHQECLVQWLKVSRQKHPKCELCGEPFHFQNVYAAGTPTLLTIYEVVLELLPRIFTVLKTILYIAFSSFFWGVCLPLFTNWWIRLCWCLVSESDVKVCSISIVPLIDSIEHLTLAWYYGIINICVVIAVSVLCFELGQIMYREFAIAERNQRTRTLERQLVENVVVMHNLERERRDAELRVMAINDYEALKYEWDLAKHQHEHNAPINFQATMSALARSAEEEGNPDGEMENGDTRDEEMPSALEVNAHLVASLRIDVKYMGRILPKLAELSEVTGLEYFSGLRDVYSTTHSTFLKHLGDERSNVEPSSEDIDDKGMIGEVNDMQTGALPSSPRQVIQRLVADPTLHDTVLQKLRETDSVSLRLGSSAATPPMTVNNSYSSINGTDVVGSSSGSAGQMGSGAVDTDDLERRGRLMMQAYNDELERKVRAAAAAETSQVGEEVEDEEQKEDQQCSNEEGEEALALTDESLVVPDEQSVLENETIDNQVVEAIEAVIRSIGEHHSNDGSNATASSEVLMGLESAGNTSGDGHVIDNSVIAESGVDESQTQTDSSDSAADVQIEIDITIIPARDAVQEVAEVAVPLENPADGNPAVVNPPEADAPHIADQPIGQVAVVEAPQVVAPADAMNNAARNGDVNMQLGLKYLLVCIFYIAVFVVALLVVPAFLGRLLFEGTIVPESLKLRARAVIERFLEQDNVGAILSSKLVFDLEHHSLAAVTDKLAGAAALSAEDKAAVGELMYWKFKTLLEILIGYGVYALLAAFAYASYCAHYLRAMQYFQVPSLSALVRHQITNIQNGLIAFSKLSLMLVFYGVLLPIGVSLLISKGLARSLSPALTGSSGGEASDVENLTVLGGSYSVDPVQVLFGLFLYLFSFLFMAHIMTMAAELRQLVHKDYLVDFLPKRGLFEARNRDNAQQNVQINVVIGLNMNVNINNRAPNPQLQQLANNQQNIDNVRQTLAQLTFGRLFQKFVSNIAIIVPCILVSIALPLRFGHFLCPLSEGPLVFRFKSVVMDVQVPVEMVLSHIFLPMLIEKLHYKANMRRVLSAYLSVAATWLDLRWLLSPDAFPAQPVVLEAVPVVPLGDAVVPAPVPVPIPPVELVAPAEEELNGAAVLAPEPQLVGDEAALPDTVQSASPQTAMDNAEESKPPPSGDLSQSYFAARGWTHNESASVALETAALDSSSSSDDEAEIECSMLSVSSVDGDDVALPEHLAEDRGSESGLSSDGDNDSLTPMAANQSLSDGTAFGFLESPDATGAHSWETVYENPSEKVGSGAESASVVGSGVLDEHQEREEAVEIDQQPVVQPMVPMNENMGEDGSGAVVLDIPLPHDAAPLHGQKVGVQALPTEVRLVLLVLVGMAFFALVSSWAIHAPLFIGRRLLALCRIPPTNDLFNYPVGLIVCWASSFVLEYMARDLMANFHPATFVRVVAKWSLIALKVLLLGAVWLSVPPLAVGMFFEALFIIPLRTPLNESPQYPFLQCWAIGLILFKVWTRCVLTGMFGDIPLRLQFEQILIRGFAQFDAMTTLRRVVWPTIAGLLDYLLVPYFLARVACMFVSSYLTRTLIVRFCIHAYILARALVWAAVHLWTYLRNLHNEIRDSRYLIGTKLTNREKKDK